MDYQNQTLQEFVTEFNAQLSRVQTTADLEQLRIAFFGRKGKLADLMAMLTALSVEERRIVGPEINAIKQSTHTAFEAKKQELTALEELQKSHKKAHFDVTAYKPGYMHGSLHPYTTATQDIEKVFMAMGFSIADGPEAETDYANFEALNIPKNHPARDMQDTFWLDVPDLLLRTHTSNVQYHSMLHKPLPLAIAVPGRVYRYEATDASHDFMFLQCEGLVIDKNISMAHLFGVVKQFLEGLFHQNLSLRLRPSYFPFVEPGVEFDISCPFCTTGCSVCKKTRWIEVGGAGLVHPNVLKAGNINPDHYSGFAFGFGLTRLVMLKYGINDIRLLHNPKIDFLKQF